MIILCDSNEKLPFEFKHAYIEGVEKCSLDVGDYGCRYKDNHIPAIYFERKSLTDLFGTLGKGYPRFKKEIQRSKDNQIELIIIIEGTITDILNGTAWSTIDGKRILRTLLTLWNKYKIASVYCKNREEASIFITEYFLAHARVRNLRNNNV